MSVLALVRAVSALRTWVSVPPRGPRLTVSVAPSMAMAMSYQTPAALSALAVSSTVTSSASHSRRLTAFGVTTSATYSYSPTSAGGTGACWNTFISASP